MILSKEDHITIRMNGDHSVVDSSLATLLPKQVQEAHTVLEGKFLCITDLKNPDGQFIVQIIVLTTF